MRVLIGAIALTLATAAIVPAVSTWDPVSAPTLEASQIRLNFYRSEGGSPWCRDTCDDIVCCTVGGPGA